MKKWTMIGLVLVLVTAVASTALAVPRVWGNRNGYSWGSQEQWKYTQEDYKLALSLKTDGYEAMSVGEFDKRTADWTNEEVFHKQEESLRRLLRSYPGDGENADFIYMTLEVAFDACSIKHYGGYCTTLRPSFSDDISRVREADVFGDKYPVFEAEISYSITYEVPDEAKLTVGERNRLLLAYRTAMQQFMDARTEKELLDEKSIERSLKKELARLDKDLSTSEMKLLGTSLDYYYAYDETTDAKAEAG